MRYTSKTITNCSKKSFEEHAWSPRLDENQVSFATLHEAKRANRFKFLYFFTQVTLSGEDILRQPPNKVFNSVWEINLLEFLIDDKLSEQNTYHPSHHYTKKNPSESFSSARSFSVYYVL